MRRILILFCLINNCSLEKVLASTAPNEDIYSVNTEPSEEDMPLPYANTGPVILWPEISNMPHYDFFYPCYRMDFRIIKINRTYILELYDALSSPYFKKEVYSIFLNSRKKKDNKKCFFSGSILNIEDIPLLQHNLNLIIRSDYVKLFFFRVYIKQGDIPSICKICFLETNISTLSPRFSEFFRIMEQEKDPILKLWLNREIQGVSSIFNGKVKYRKNIAFLFRR